MKHFNTDRNDHLKPRLYEAGFTMIELVIVLLVAGFMLVPVYFMLFHVTKLEPDDRRFEVIQKAIAEHVRVTGTLPCPADPALPVTDAAAFSGNCGAAGVVNSGGVSIGAVPIDNLRAAVGCEDDGFLPDQVGGALKNTLFSAREFLLGGTGAAGARTYVPNDSKCPQRAYIANERGAKFIYAMTTAASSVGYDIFDPAAGAVIVEDAAGNPATSNEVPYVLVNTGADQKGAFRLDGSLSPVACVPAAGNDAENCNGDATFVAAPRSEVAGGTYFDDTVDFGLASFFSEDSFMRWGNQGSGGRNVILSDRARLSVGTVNPNDASPIAGDSGLVLNSDTMSARTLVFDGNMDIAQSEDAGGNLLEQSGFSINLRSNAENIIPTGGFCYCPSLGGAGTPCQIACDTTP